MEAIVLLMRLILLIMQLPLLITKPAPAFMVDMATVPYAQYVAEGFVLLITAVHGFRYILVYVYKDDHIAAITFRSQHRSRSRDNCSYLCALSS